MKEIDVKNIFDIPEINDILEVCRKEQRDYLFSLGGYDISDKIQFWESVEPFFGKKYNIEIISEEKSIFNGEDLYDLVTQDEIHFLQLNIFEDNKCVKAYYFRPLVH